MQQSFSTGGNPNSQEGAIYPTGLTTGTSIGFLEPYDTIGSVSSSGTGPVSDTSPLAALAHPHTSLDASGHWSVAVLGPTVTSTATQVRTTLTSQDYTRALSGNSVHSLSVPVLVHSGTSVSTMHTPARSIQDDLWGEAFHLLATALGCTLSLYILCSWE
jgi:hypothetical protein